MADNLDIYEAVRHVPETAQKEIVAGRLKGKTDINPIWRIKTLTEQFGPCGIGWKYKILDKRLEQGGNGEIAAFVDIDLYIRYAGEWSEGIPGTGGAMFAANEKNGLYISDECFKMALTDAISVSCKALGIGADVYWAQDATKYEGKPVNQDISTACPNSGKVPPSRNTEQRPAMAAPKPAAGKTAAFPTPPPNNDAPQAGAQGQGLCPVCGGAISEAERKYSLDKFGRVMCRKCQARNKS